MEFKENWHTVVKALEKIIPHYEEVNRYLSLGYAEKASMDPELSMQESHRVYKNKGQLTIIDIGKPDNRILRAAMRLYMHVLMPIFAKMIIRRKIKGNPWCLLAPTYKELPTNKSLRYHLQEAFGSASMREFLFGAIVVLRDQKSQRS